MDSLYDLLKRWVVSPVSDSILFVYDPIATNTLIVLDNDSHFTDIMISEYIQSILDFDVNKFSPGPVQVQR